MPTQEEVSIILKQIASFVVTHPYDRIPFSLYEGLDPRNLRATTHNDEYIQFVHIDVTYYDLNNTNLCTRYRLTVPKMEIIRNHLRQRPGLEAGQVYRVPVNRIIPIMLRPEAGLVTPEEYRLQRQQGIPRVNYGPNKLHPPYPLIGLEYEPQLTLLNYPKKRVHVVCSRYNTRVRQTRPNGVILDLPYKFITKIDQDNLEFRTSPVKLEELPKEIEKLQLEMESLVMEITKAVGPVGIFLPAQPCTKHINLSGLDKPITIADVEIKTCGYGNRYHFRVPYSFTDYNHIATAPFYYFQQTEPILLGYSMTGDSFVRRCELP